MDVKNHDLETPLNVSFNWHERDQESQERLAQPLFHEQQIGAFTRACGCCLRGDGNNLTQSEVRFVTLDFQISLVQRLRLSALRLRQQGSWSEFYWLQLRPSWESSSPSSSLPKKCLLIWKAIYGQQLGSRTRMPGLISEALASLACSAFFILLNTTLQTWSNIDRSTPKSISLPSQVSTSL